MGKRTNIGSRLHSVERGNVVAGANEILDDAKGKKQNVINNEVDAELVRLDQSKQDNLTFDNQPTEGSDNPVKSGGVYAADKALSDAIEAILILIPSAATALNQLADKNFVNSSIATDTATFRGTSETGLSEAQFIEWANSLTHDMNDYVFWQTIDEDGNTLFKRYKWNGTQWLYEYTLNNSSFTADQWAAITSGITTALVEKLVGLPTNAALQQALNSKQNSLTFDNVPTENSTNPVKSGGVYSAVKAEENARLNLAQTVSEIGGDVSQIEDVIPTGATAQNQLVANASMGAYVASIIQNITASFTLSTADGHINLTLTQVNGRVATLTLSSSDIASAQALSALTGRVTTAEENITALGGRVSTNETDIANLQQLYNDLQQSKPVPVTALPSTGQQQGVIYRLAGTTSYSDYMWNGSTWVLMATYNNAIDPRPKKASQNLVLSGGVFDNMGALDVSELNATENPHTLALYVDLSAALAAIPTDYQKGGMSVKFVQSSDNKYVQFFCTADDFTTDVTQWSFCGNDVYIENPIFIEAKTDSDDRLLEARQADGRKVEFGDFEVKGNIINEKYNSNFNNIDKIINNENNESPHGYLSEIENEEWMEVTTDSEGKIISGTKGDGSKYSYKHRIDNLYVGSLKLDDEGIKELGDELYEHEDEKANYFLAFANLVCVGDSLTQGMVLIDRTLDPSYRVAHTPYPQAVSRLSGNIPYQIIARGGYTAKQIWDNKKDEIVEKENPVAVVFLGNNGGLTDTLSTDVVGDNPENWADNNIGCYCRIVDKLKNFDYKIILLRVFRTTEVSIEETNDAINHVAERFGCVCIDAPYSSKPVYHRGIIDGYDYLHSNDIGYVWFAQRLIEDTSRISDEQIEYLI